MLRRSAGVDKNFALRASRFQGDDGGGIAVNSRNINQVGYHALAAKADEVGKGDFGKSQPGIGQGVVGAGDVNVAAVVRRLANRTAGNEGGGNGGVGGGDEVFGFAGRRHFLNLKHQRNGCRRRLAAVKEVGADSVGFHPDDNAAGVGFARRIGGEVRQIAAAVLQNNLAKFGSAVVGGSFGNDHIAR